MKVIAKYQLGLLVWVTMAAASCSTTKSVPQGDALYTGASVSIKDDFLKKKKEKALRKELEALTRPHPNSKFVGMPIKLWLYHLGGNAKSGNGA